MIKLCVPGRFEMELLDHLEPLQEETGRIHEVYGSLSRSVVGSGRPARRLAQQGGEPTFDDVRSFTERAHASGIRVNYLLNAITLNHDEYTGKGRRELVDYIGQVADTGVDMVTIAVPYLMELVREEFPELPICISVVCEIANSHGMRLFEGYGAERIHFAEECNRDLELLGEMVKQTDSDVSLVVNNGCLRFCPHRVYHHSLCTQGSQSDKPVNSYVDYPLLKCSVERARNPVEILRSPWIRPEDLTFYEDRFGVELFKIAGRQLPLQLNVNVIQAYARLKYEGNLMDLLATPAANFAKHPMTAAIAAERGPDRYTPPPFYFDNTKLGQLTKALHARGGCSALRDCEECRLCDELLPEVLAEDPEAERTVHAEALDELIGELADGSWTA